MNKSELIDAMAGTSGLTKKDSEKALNALLDAIMQSLAGGEDVVLPNFGSFKVKERAARQGRNPQTGAPLTIAAKKVPTFSAGKGLKEAVV